MTQTQNADNPLANTVCISLSITGIGNRRKLKSELVECDADKTMLGLNKKLIDAPELSAILKLDGEIRQWLYGISLPSFFREGVYRIKLDAVAVVEEKLTAYAEKRQGLVDALLAVYSERVEEARARLRAAFDASQYPTAKRLASAFALTWNYIEAGVPGSLAGVSQALYQRELDIVKQKANEALDEYRTILRVGFADLVDHMVEKLGVRPNGKAQIFHDSSVEGFKTFLQNFNLRDVTNDAQLSELIEAAKKLLNGTQPDQLRESESAKSRVKGGLEAVKAKLDTLLVDRPRRQISFEDE